MTLNDFVKEHRKALSPLMENRQKLSTEDAIGKELTIIDCDFVTDENGEPYSIILFAETPDYFLFGGKVLTDILLDTDKQLKEVNSDIRTELKATGLKIKMTRVHGKKYYYTGVEIL